MAKRIEVLFVVETLGDQSNIILDGGPNLPPVTKREVEEILLIVAYISTPVPTHL